MTNDGSKLRDVMGRHLDGLQPATSIEHIRQRARRGRLLMATTLVALVAVVSASGALMLDRFANDDLDRVVGPAPASDDGLIAFTTQDQGEPMPWIAVVPANGGNATRLHEGSHPSWSPDGGRLAFACHPGICTMKADGTDVVRLTHPEEPVLDEDPDWGSGGYIAFTRTPEDGSRDIYVIPEDGGKASPASPVIEEGANFAASWSPDGRAIAFTRGEGPFLEAPKGGFQLWTLNIDGSELRQLTETGADRPDWSPDERNIVFDHASAIWVIPSVGGEARKLEPATTGEHPDTGAFPTWSPDGERIAYTCEALGFGHHDLCSVSPDGTGRTTILATPANESFPAWQPSPATPSEGGSFPLQGSLGHVSVDATIEIDLDHDRVCLVGDVEGARAAHLHLDEPSANDPVIIRFYEPPETFAGGICVEGTINDELARVVARPSDYFVDFHADEASEPLEIYLAESEGQDDFTSESPPCDDDRSYGQTIPGRWLENLILEIGAPGGYEVTKEEVKDTGTALWIDIPAYEEQSGIYAVMITVGDGSNATDKREKRIGRQGTYDLYFDGGNQYRAANTRWQLSLLAYPNAPEDDISWPDQTRDWLTQAAEMAEESPPQCSGPLN